MRSSLLQRQDLAASHAGAAGLERGTLTLDQLREPERRPLLPHAGRAGEEQGARESSRAPGRGEASAGILVTPEGRQRHGKKVGCGVDFGNRYHCNGIFHNDLGAKKRGSGEEVDDPKMKRVRALIFPLASNCSLPPLSACRPAN